MNDLRAVPGGPLTTSRILLACSLAGHGEAAERNGAADPGTKGC
jgi:hypothetical protein